jgi:Ca2+-binding RTX toxin-like protein
LATIFQNEDNIGTRLRLQLVDETDLVVADGVTVQSTDSNAVHCFGGGHNIVIHGDVLAVGRAFWLIRSWEDWRSEPNVVTIIDGGSIIGDIAAITTSTLNTFIRNRGNISSDGNGIEVYGGSLTIHNDGTISGGAAAIYSISGEISLDVVNRGTIIGGEFAYYGGYWQDTVINRGLIIGDVHLGSGAGSDVFDNRGGTIQGTVFGGGAGDTFMPGLGAETFDAGIWGKDTLDFSTSKGLRVSLADGSSTGAAEGDTYISFEIVMGSARGSDTLIGNSGRSTNLNGLGGHDTLVGGSKGDVLEGGLGRDTLTGGLGSDLFRYRSPTEGGDTITDFDAAADAIRIKAANFGGGLAGGSPLADFQFQTRADNFAQDADDRFIFRTTDNTLWFDRDGSDPVGPVLIADLQHGAVVTHLDILLV